MNIELNMNLARRMLIDGERKYSMFRTSNNAKKKLLRNVKEVCGKGSMA